MTERGRHDGAVNPAIIVVVAAAAALTFRQLRGEDADARAQTATLAKTFNCTVQGSSLVLGDHRVRIQRASQGWDVDVSASAPAGCPEFRLLRAGHVSLVSQDIRVGDAGLDARWVVQSRSVLLMRTTFPYGIEDVLPELTRELTLSKGLLHIRVHVPLKPIQEAVEELVAGMSGIRDELTVGRWAGSSTLEARALTRCSGKVGDLTVTARLVERGGLRTVIETRRPMPLSMWHKDHGRPRTALNHAILDKLVYVEGDSSRLQDPDTMSACLEVVHGHPGSRIEHWGVRREHEGVLHGEGLDAAIAKVVAAARSLS